MAPEGTIVKKLKYEEEQEQYGPNLVLKCKNMIRETVAELKRTSENVRLDLSIGDPTKFGGHFGVAEILKESLLSTLNHDKMNGYAPAIGLDRARKAIATRYQDVNYEDVIITSGCSGALDFVFRSLAGKGDSILVPVPGFPLYETLLKLYQINIIRYKLDSERDWQVDFESFPKVNKEKVKGVIICNPSNPTGSVFSLEHLKEIMMQIKSNFPNAVCIADQVYEDVVFDLNSKFYDMGPIGKELGIPTVTVSGIAKGFHAPGWRMGWLVHFKTDQSFQKKLLI